MRYLQIVLVAYTLFLGSAPELAWAGSRVVSKQKVQFCLKLQKHKEKTCAVPRAAKLGSACKSSRLRYGSSCGTLVCGGLAPDGCSPENPCILMLIEQTYASKEALKSAGAYYLNDGPCRSGSPSLK